MEITNSGATVTADGQSKTSRTTEKALGKDQFLQLLVAQMRTQNPMEPMKDKEFIAQMAQFSSLEQMKNVAQGFEQLNATLGEFMRRQNSDDGGKFFQALNLLDKEILAVDAAGEVVRGIVTGVSANSGDPKVYLEDKVVNWQNIIEVSIAPQQQAGGEAGDQQQNQSETAVGQSDTADSATSATGQE